MQVWKMLAAVLYMSNLAFDKVDHEQGEIASISDREVRKFHRLCFFTLGWVRGVAERVLSPLLCDASPQVFSFPSKRRWDVDRSTLVTITCRFGGRGTGPLLGPHGMLYNPAGLSLVSFFYFA